MIGYEIILIKEISQLCIMYCEECGYEPLKKTVDIKNTRLFICPECFNEQTQFINGQSCKHEYDDKSNNRCIHCANEK